MKSIISFKKLIMMTVVLLVAFYFLMWNDSSLSVANMLKTTTKIDVKNIVCQVNFNDSRRYIEDNNSDLKMIYFVTPTYPRPEQVPELTRLAHTLMHVPRLHWIIADDEPVCSSLVTDILKRSGLPYTHISSPKPYVYKTSVFPRGVANRRAAISWLHDNVHDGGVLYFGDDDNTLDLRIFNEIRRTKRVSMFPVGFIGTFGVSTPVVKDGKVVGFFDSWPAKRKFPVDMAGFAINMDYLKPSAVMPYIAGFEEDKFLRSLGLEIEDIEPLADNCTKVLVWHTRTTKNKKPTLKVDLHDIENLKKFDNFAKLLDELNRLGIAQFDSSTGTKLFITRSSHHNVSKLLTRRRRSVLFDGEPLADLSQSSLGGYRRYLRIWNHK